MTDDASKYRRYLLGELDEPERDELEEKLLTSDEPFQELLIAEEELVDDYHAGKLSAGEEEKYRGHFLAAEERREQHRFGAALRKHVAEAAAKDRPAWLQASRWLAAAAILSLAAGIYLMLPHPYPLEPTPPGAPGSGAAFFLTTDTLRGLPDPGEPPQTIRIPPGADRVELQLDLPSGSEGEYRVTLESARGVTVAEGTLPAQDLEGQRVIVATVPAELLAPGDYRVLLERAEEPSDRESFAFRISSP